ncbi:DUF2262 domain-containing protein [Pasteurella atlantica]|uniref:DUF2262 domain-containing protein n=2 Tax=Pasteurellaceae TaxID=712 RepID=A0ACC6HK51_9PAST|nr:DUF2262 domain-containing protein [Pasteurella atlantica]MDP8051241.1 DUF2262 domain-containing protein [Pasteurella atlantica]MDP8104536.1 DUF2262 domain-containing protein [Pasteurella atlantica]MDP8147911.1 DUF2262 domain-containing protein [Pasteurella atlantica]
MKNINLTQNEDYQSYESIYNTEEIEILVLFSDKSGGGVKFRNSWDLSAYFLAYINLQTNELHEGDGRINWLLSDELNKSKGLYYPYYFQDGEICRLKVRELKDKTIPEGMLESAYNKFMVVEVLEREVQAKQLEKILEEYRKPVIISDDILGEFQLNKDLDFFEGSIEWLDNKVSVYLNIDQDDKNTYQLALDILRYIHKEQSIKDQVFRKFAAEELTDLANDWAEDPDTEITEEEFAKRISLSSLSIDYDGTVLAYYDDDDMFYSHIIEIMEYKNKLDSAEIAG